MKRSAISAAALAFAFAPSVFAGAAAAQELHIALADDPGSLDPATNASFVGRVSLQSVCDKLFDIDAEGNVIPMLVESWDWADDNASVTLHLRQGVKFQDGTDFDADAVVYNIDRYKTMEGSRRRAELTVIDMVEKVDDATVVFHLTEPNVALLTQLTDRAGMMVSPAAAKAAKPEAFAVHPVCAGPYTLAEYNPQQTVVLKKFPDYWNADAFHFDKVVFSALPDSNVRLLNLRSGDLDVIERVPPSDIPSVEADPSLAIAYAPQPAYTTVQFNLSGPHANPDFANHPEVRDAFSLALDRDAINQVIFAGKYSAGNQMFPPSNQWYDKDFPVEPRNIEAAKAKLAEVGLDHTTLNLMISTSTENQAVAEMMKAMVSEAGITLNILPTEFISMRQQAAKGDFEAYMIGSSGRPDPDLNISLMLVCDTANNVGKYCNKELDDTLAAARATADVAKRKPLYDKAIAIIMKDKPAVYFNNPRSAYAFTSKLQNFETFPDAIIRLTGVSLAE